MRQSFFFSVFKTCTFLLLPNNDDATARGHFWFHPRNSTLCNFFFIFFFSAAQGIFSSLYLDTWRNEGGGGAKEEEKKRNFLRNECSVTIVVQCLRERIFIELLELIWISAMKILFLTWSLLHSWKYDNRYYETVRS